MRTFALSAIGLDRPGIIAGVAERLVEHGVNVTDSQMGILRGHFAMTLVVTAPDEVDAPRLARDLDAVAAELGLEAVALRPVEEAPAGAPAEPTHAVTVHGADHPGILAAMTRALAAAGANVCDLQTRLSGDLYVMFIEVAAPGGLDAGALDAVAAEQGVDVTVRDVEADTL